MKRARAGLLCIEAAARIDYFSSFGLNVQNLILAMTASVWLLQCRGFIWCSPWFNFGVQ